MNEQEKTKVWFHAKRYGWGWGLPARWQGWAVLLGYVLLLTGGAFMFDMDRQMPLYLIFTGVITVILLAVCWLKGEKPSWRWGGVQDSSTKRINARWLLVFHVFLGPLLLGFALYVRAHPPQQINGTYGYRTTMSMQSQEAWDEAQHYSANIMLVAALITIVYQAVSCFIMKPFASFLTSAAILVIALCTTIPLTQAHLKKHFDNDGNKIISENSSWR